MSDANADHPERLQDILSRMGERFFSPHRRMGRSLNRRIQQEAAPRRATKPLPLHTASNSTHDPRVHSIRGFLEVGGFFTPSSKRIENIYIKEKKIREYVDPQGKRRILKTKISANYELGLPVTSDLNYYRAFLKICDEIVDRDGRFRFLSLYRPRNLSAMLERKRAQKSGRRYDSGSNV